MQLLPVGRAAHGGSNASGASSRDIARAVRVALGGGPAALIGASEHAPREAPAGTAIVLETSGSTGFPKRVVLSRSALTASALATRERIGPGRWLLALPAASIAGVQVVVRSVLDGEEVAILDGRFTAQTFVHAARGMRSSRAGVEPARFTSLVPAQVATLLADDDASAELARFDAVLVGGQRMPDALARRAADAGVRIVRTYGMTETAGGCVYDGRPLAGVSVRVRDGEVQLAGPMLAEGYLDDEALTARAFVVDNGIRWFRTGDAGSVTDGMLSVTGRRDNVIVSGGVNVSLDRVEALAATVAGLDGVLAVGMADERWGAVPVLVSEQTISDAALAEVRTLAARDIGVAARPARSIRVDSIPLLATGKPDRRAITQRLAESARHVAEASSRDGPTGPSPTGPSEARS